MAKSSRKSRSRKTRRGGGFLDWLRRKISGPTQPVVTTSNPDYSSTAPVGDTKDLYKPSSDTTSRFVEFGGRQRSRRHRTRRSKSKRSH